MDDVNDKELVIFSIGNPGPMNRHSAGHLVLKELVDGFNGKQLIKASGKGKYYYTAIDGIAFVKSNAYMNESGEALKQYLQNEKVRAGQITLIILYDEFDLPLNKVKLSPFKKNESHNGVKCVRNLLLQSYPTVAAFKLGVGIGPKPQNASKDTMASWVLSNFKESEKQALLETSVPLVFKYIEAMLQNNGVIKDCQRIANYVNMN